MSEPTQSKAKNQIALLMWGYLLLLSGFLWLSASRVLFDPGVVAKGTHLLSEGVPQKESYTRDEMFHLVQTFSRQVRDDPPWIFTPALLMLVGGLLIGRSNSRR